MQPRHQSDGIREHLCVMRAQRGDGNAFHELIGLYERKLLYFVRRFERDEDRALDILQEVWLAAFKRLSTLRNPAAFRVWIYRIARAKTVNCIRRQTREVETDRSACGEEQPVRAGPSHRLENAELVHRALERVSADHREVLTLRFLEDMPLAEIAEVLEINLGTVKSRLHYAKQAFRTQAEELSDGRTP